MSVLRNRPVNSVLLEVIYEGDEENLEAHHTGAVKKIFGSSWSGAERKIVISNGKKPSKCIMRKRKKKIMEYFGEAHKEPVKFLKDDIEVSKFMKEKLKILDSSDDVVLDAASVPFDGKFF